MAAEKDQWSASPPVISDLLASFPLLPGVGSGVVDRRKKRRVKNLESATRSRARKQAHLALVETEVVELRETNKQLRLQYAQLLKATVEVPVHVTKTLQRVLSAPF